MEPVGFTPDNPDLVALAKAARGLIPLDAAKQPVPRHKGALNHPDQRWNGGPFPAGTVHMGWRTDDAALRCLDIDRVAWGMSTDPRPAADAPVALVPMVVAILADGGIPARWETSAKGGHILIPRADQGRKEANTDTTGTRAVVMINGQPATIYLDLRGRKSFVTIRDPGECLRAVREIAEAPDPLADVGGWRASRTLAERVGDLMVALRSDRLDGGRNARHGMAVRREWGEGELPSTAWVRWFRDRLDGGDKAHADRTIGDAVRKGALQSQAATEQIDVRRDGAMAIAWADTLAGTVRVIAGDESTSRWLAFDGRWDQGAQGWVRGVDARREVHRKLWRFIERAQADGQLFAPDDKDPLVILDNTRRQGAIVAQLENRRTVEIDPAELDAVPGLIGLPGGFVWETMRTDQGPDCVRRVTQDDLITRRLAVAPDWLGTCPTWDAFLAFAVPDETERAWLLGWIRYVLTGTRPFHTLFVLQGEGGTGKGTFAEALRDLFGSADSGGYAAKIAVQNLSTRPDGATSWAARLESTLLAVTEEPKRHLELDAAAIKDLTGGGTYTARHHYQADRERVARAAVMMLSNHFLQLPEDDPGITRRLRTMRWDHKPDREDEGLPGRLKHEGGAFLAKVAREGDPDAVRESRTPETMRTFAAAALVRLSTVADAIGNLPGIEIANGAERKNVTLAKAFGSVGIQDLLSALSKADPEEHWTGAKLGKALSTAEFLTVRRKIDGTKRTFVLGIRGLVLCPHGWAAGGDACPICPASDGSPGGRQLEVGF